MFRRILSLWGLRTGVRQMSRRKPFKSSSTLFYFFLILSKFSHCYGGLYNVTTDNVSVLTDENFDKEVVGSSNCWIAEFYNSWCGHCVRFAPKWKELATSCIGWREVIKVAAIDCAEKENKNICMRYPIEGYPTIMFIPARSTQPPKLTELQQLSSVQEMKVQMIKLVSNQSLSNIDPKLIQPLNPIKTRNDIWQQTTSTEQKAIVIYESSDSSIGREVILTTYNHRDDLVIRRIVVDSLPAGVVSLPSSYLMTGKGGETMELLSNSSTSPGHLTALKSLAEKRPTEDANVHSRVKVDDVQWNTSLPLNLKDRADDDDDSTIDWRSDSYMKLHEVDVVSGLFFSLRHEIPLRGHLDVNRVKILVGYLQTLVQYLPIREDLLLKLRFLHRKLKSTSSVVGFSGLEGPKWLELVDGSFGKLIALDRREWMGCRGSSSSLRGYPCSLWMTFHAITVAAAVRENSKDVNCVGALLSIRGYVENFFGCKECVENFMRGAVKIESLVRTCPQSVVFLWRSHNKANLKLKGDPSEDPGHPKTQFPNGHQCPSCRHSSSAEVEFGRRNKTSISGLVDEWNEKEVFEFLVEVYRVPYVTRELKKNVLAPSGGGVTGLTLAAAAAANGEKDGEEDKGAGEGAADEYSDDKFQLPSVLVEMSKTFLGTQRNRSVLESNRKTVQKESEILLVPDDSSSVTIQDSKTRRKSPAEMKLGDSHGQLTILTIFNQNDVKMCLSFYIFCAILLVFLYLHFIRRLRTCKISNRMKQQV